jgi:hypothetical protein
VKEYEEFANSETFQNIKQQMEDNLEQVKQEINRYLHKFYEQ